VNWNSAADFFAMGGYGTYVWGAYAVTLACMAIEPVLVVLRHRRARQPRFRDCRHLAAAQGDFGADRGARGRMEGLLSALRVA